MRIIQIKANNANVKVVILFKHKFKKRKSGKIRFSSKQTAGHQFIAAAFVDSRTDSQEYIRNRPDKHRSGKNIYSLR
jgi:hypothetical protein